MEGWLHTQTIRIYMKQVRAMLSDFPTLLFCLTYNHPLISFLAVGGISPPNNMDHFSTLSRCILLRQCRVARFSENIVSPEGCCIVPTGLCTLSEVRDVQLHVSYCIFILLRHHCLMRTDSDEEIEWKRRYHVSYPL